MKYPPFHVHFYIRGFQRWNAGRGDASPIRCIRDDDYIDKVPVAVKTLTWFSLCSCISYCDLVWDLWSNIRRRWEALNNVHTKYKEAIVVHSSLCLLLLREFYPRKLCRLAWIWEGVLKSLFRFCHGHIPYEEIIQSTYLVHQWFIIHGLTITCQFHFEFIQAHLATSIIKMVKKPPRDPGTTFSTAAGILAYTFYHHVLMFSP